MAGSNAKLKFSGNNDPFEARLKAEVAAYLAATPAQGKLPARAYLRIATFVISTFALYCGYVFWAQSWGAALLLGVLGGISTAGIGFNLVHEATHEHFDSSHRANRWLAFSLDFFGMSSFYYRVKHCSIHHGYTNIYGFDGDIEQTGMLRMAPGAALKPVHRWQARYAPLLYACLTLTWCLFFDFQRLASGKIAAAEIPPPRGSSRRAFWLGKLNSLVLTLLIPALIHGPAVALVGLLVFHLTVGSIFSLFFQMSHLFIGTVYPVPEFEGNTARLPHSWYRHQLLTTMDFAPENRALRFYLGGLNFQVIHHLFPAVATDYLYDLHHIVRRVSAEAGVAYHIAPTLKDAVSSHFKHLDDLGRA